MTVSHKLTTPDIQENHNGLYNMEFIYIKNTDPDYTEMRITDMFDTLDTLIETKNVIEIRPRTR
jgi:hypothetical protein